MSVKVMASVWEHSQQKGTALLMLLAIADNANEYGEAWPGIDHLAEKCRMKRRNAQLLLKELAESGELLIAVQEGQPTPHGKTNMFTIVTLGALVRHGVQSSTPHAPRDAKGYTPGVQSTVERGAIYGSDGVQSSTPKPSLEPSRTLSGGEAREPVKQPAAAVFNPRIANRLMDECDFGPGQAKRACTQQVIDDALVDRLAALTVRLKSQGKVPAKIICPYTDVGRLPEDLPKAKGVDDDFYAYAPDGQIDYAATADRVRKNQSLVTARR